MNQTLTELHAISLTGFSSPPEQAESSGAEETEEQPAVLAAMGDQIAAAKAADAAVDSLKENSTYNPRRMRPKRCAGHLSKRQSSILHRPIWLYFTTSTTALSTVMTGSPHHAPHLAMYRSNTRLHLITAGAAVSVNQT